MGALAPEWPGCPAVADVAARAPLPAGPPAERDRPRLPVSAPTGTVNPVTGLAGPETQASRGW
ncbi:hypothetical protein E4J66_10535 [Actinomyces viscosus]|nr:hypothetical protein E4J66_10535 [Actinomyces viscosus]